MTAWPLGIHPSDEIYCNLGGAQRASGHARAAVDAYTKAAALSSNPAVAYFNLCATNYNAGNTSAALAACDKAIAADPAKADAYFIKGSAMVGNGAIDQKGKFAVPKGTVETLKKYLELQPNGAHASDVKEMLNAIK